MHGYASTAILGSERDGSVARVSYGGTHEYPHAQVTSDWAQPGAELIRARFPEHSVSRLDVREDFAEPDAFDSIQAQLLEVASAYRVQVGTAGDHLLTLKGRTVYLGSTKSAVRMRLYDKAAEMESKVHLPMGLDKRAYFGIPEHLTRLEAQIRPATKAAKSAFASIEPVAALGSAPWMRDVWKGVMGLDLEAVQVRRGYRQGDDERAYAYLLGQYGAVLRRMCQDLGSWECVGLTIGGDLARSDKPC
jgi:hypothetical protein